jgi:hypothetical protein
MSEENWLEPKTCIKCGETKTRQDFPIMVKHSTVRAKLRSHCKDCDKALSKQRAELKKKYGTAPENHTCPICLRTEKELREKTEQKSLWALDHCHDTGEFRDWICHPCNRAMGGLGDDIETLKRAIKHLEKNKKPVDKSGSVGYNRALGIFFGIVNSVKGVVK